MRGLAYKRISRLCSLKKTHYSKMPSSEIARESVTLLDKQPQKSCCCGRFRVYGSDGVWSWGVAFANFLVNFIIVGLGRMSAVFYVDFINYFHIDRKTASIPFSVQQAGRNLFGPAAGILGEKYGIRSVTIMGGIIGSLSAGIVYWRMDITSVTFLWGLCFGLSTALTTTINQVSIDQYFEKYRVTAGGFAFSGGCIGAMVFPIVLETLIQHYGLKGAFLVMGAIILNVVPAALVLIEPPWKGSESSDSSYVNNIKQYGSFDGEKSSYIANISPQQIKIPSEKQKNLTIYGIDFRFLRDNSDMVYQFLTMDVSDGSVRSKINYAHNINKSRFINELEDIYSAVSDQERNLQNLSIVFPIDKSANNQSTYILQNDPSENVPSDNGNNEHPNNDAELGIFIQHKLQELFGMRGTRLISHFPYPEQHRAWKVLVELRKLSEELADMSGNQLFISIPQYIVSSKSSGNEIQEQNSDRYSNSLDSIKSSNSFCNLIKTALILHKNPLFLLICLCRGVFMLTFIPLATIVVDYAIDHGLPKTDGKYVIAILSLGDFIGRLGLGWITDREYLSLPKYMVVGMIALGASTATLPLMNSRPSILLSVLIFAILQGSLFVRHPILVSHYVEKHEKSIGMGFINFFSGFLGFALPSYIGYFRDHQGSYDCMFYVNGSICATVGLLWLLEPLLTLFVSSKHENSNN